MVLSKSKNKDKPHLWFVPKTEKTIGHTRGLVQNQKRRSTTPVVGVKSENNDKPHSWSEPKWEKMTGHTCGLVQNQKRWSTTPVESLN